MEVDEFPSGPQLCNLAPPPDSRTAIARGASIVPFVGVWGLSTAEAGMPENVVPFSQHFSKMVRTCSQQVRHYLSPIARSSPRCPTDVRQ